MDFIIRPVKLEDAKDIQSFMTMDGVMENTNSIYSQRIPRFEKLIVNLTDDDHFLVAEIDENGVKRVVGIVRLSANKSPRVKHSGCIGIMVHKAYQGMGIGSKLLQEILELADNWLMLVRLELGVFADNERAINLYKSFGFEVEGRKKFAAVKNGRYEDEIIMGRYRNLPH